MDYYDGLFLVQVKKVLLITKKHIRDGLLDYCNMVFGCNNPTDDLASLDHNLIS